MQALQRNVESLGAHNKTLIGQIDILEQDRKTQEAELVQVKAQVLNPRLSWQERMKHGIRDKIWHSHLAG